MAFIGKESVTVTSLDSAESMSVVTDLTVDTNTLKVDSASNRVGILNATPGVSLDIGSATDAIHIPVGTTAERPGSPASGLFRYNTSLNQFEGYTSTWGAIGGGGTNTFTHDSFTGDDTTTDFVLSQTTESENNLFVFIDGVFQTQDAYSISTNSGVTTLSLSAAPLLDRKIIVYTVAAGVSGNNLNQNLFDANTTDAVDGINTAFTLSIPPVNKNNTQVFFDGVYQHKANYSISGSVLTFTDAPPLGVIVEVMIFTQTAVNVPVDNSVTSAKLSGDLVAPGNLTVTGYLAGPATFIIDPAAVGDNTGTLLVKGDLQVDGTQTIINSTTLTVDDLNITVASGAANALAADGAGITVDTGTDPDATITYDGVNDKWDFNKNVSVTGSVTADGLTVGDTSDSQTIIQMLANSTNGANTIHFGDAASGAASYVGYINYAHDSNSMQFSANGSERLRIDSAGSTIIKSGNKLILNRTDNAIGGEMSYVAGTGFIFNDANGDGVSFNQGVANKVRITSPGNVGIGTDSPDTLLHLSGDATAIIRLENTNAGLALNSVIGSIEFEKQDASGAGVGVAGSVKLISSNASGAESSLVFSTSSTARGNNAEAMRIDGSGKVFISGGPTTGGTAQEFSVVYAADSGYYSTFGSVGQWEHYRGDGSNGGLAIKTDLSSGVWGSGGGFITFSPRATQVLKLEHDNVVFNEDGGDMDFRVESAGNANMLFVDASTNSVSIGTSVHLGGTLNLYDGSFRGQAAGALTATMMKPTAFGYAPGSYAVTMLGAPNTSGTVSIGYDPSGNPSGAFGGSGTEMLFGGNMYFTQPNATDDGYVNQIRMENQTGVTINENGEDLNFRVESVGNANMLFVDAGNNSVGIGTNSPASPLNIKKTGTVGAVQEFLRLENNALGGTNTGSSIDFYHYTDGNALNKAASIASLNTDSWPGGVPSSYSTGLTFSTLHENTFDERMRIDANGNLLVGLTSGQAAQIHVQAPKPTYTDYATVFAAGTDSNNGQHAISLMTSGNGLGGLVGSNVSIDGATFTQPVTARTSGYFSFNNTTNVGETSILTYSGFTKGTTTPVERFRVDGDGNVGIGVSPLQKLHVSGSVYASGYYITALQGNAQLTNTSTSSGSNPSYIGQGLISVTISDAKAKENFGPVEENECLNKVVSLAEHVKKFDWIDEDWKKEKGRTVGMVAQEIYENHSEFVHKPENYNDDGWAIRHQEMVPTLIKAIQEQQEQIEQLKADIAVLKGDN